MDTKIKDMPTFRQWLRDQEDREDGVGDLAQWISKKKDYPIKSEYRSWLLYYCSKRLLKSKTQAKSRLSDFDRAWYEYMYDIKMTLWDDLKKQV